VAPHAKIPTPIYMGLAFACSRHICGCKSSCSTGSWWIAHSTTC